MKKVFLEKAVIEPVYARSGESDMRGKGVLVFIKRENSFLARLINV